MIIALDGYIDAGSGVRLAVDHLLGNLEHTVVGTFDVDHSSITAPADRP